MVKQNYIYPRSSIKNHPFILCETHLQFIRFLHLSVTLIQINYYLYY